REALAVERARAGRAGAERIVDDVHEIARDARSLAACEVARLAPDGAAVHAAREEAEDRARRVGIEDHRRVARRDLARAELAQRPARGLFADRFRGVEVGEEALRRVVETAAVLVLAVGRERRDDERRVRPGVAAGEAAGED